MSHVEIYREIVHFEDEHTIHDRPGKWRWRFIKKGRIMADSGQGYRHRSDCLNGCASVLGGDVWTATTEHELAPRGVTEIGRTYITRTTADDAGVWIDIPIRDLTREAKP